MKAAMTRVGTSTRSGHAGQRAHDIRSQDEAIPKYVDRDRIHLNTEPVPVPTTSEIAAECMARRLDRYERGELRRMPQGIRSDGVVSVRGVIAFSHEAQDDIRALSVEEQDRLYLEAAQSIAERLGTTVAGLVVHRDESAPHAHYTLHGYGLDGKPVSKTMDRQALRELQDLVAQPYAHLGIQRGKPKSARIADGEDVSAWINRTVAELHRDVGPELEKARADLEAAREQHAKTTKRLEVTQEKLAQVKAEGRDLRGKVATLAKRERTYRQRIEKQQAELLAKSKRIHALEAQVKLPEPTMVDRVTKPAGRVLGIIPTAPEITPTRVYPPRAVEKQMRRAYAQRDDARQERDETIRQKNDEDRSRRRRLDTWHGAAPDPYGRTLRPDSALSGPYVVHYGVTMLDQGDRFTAPPQQASARQVASALYKVGRERGWDHQHFTTPSEDVVREIVSMAAEDDRLDSISFTFKGKKGRGSDGEDPAERILEAAKLAKADAEQRARDAIEVARRPTNSGSNSKRSKGPGM